MLVSFQVSNYRSFGEEQRLSLVASQDRAHPTHLYLRRSGERLLKSAALYGKNASGKSNLISAMQCLRTLVVDSATRWNAGDAIPGITPFRLDLTLRDKPSRFVIIISIDAHHFEYGVEASPTHIVSEWLTEMPTRRWFSRRRLETGAYQTKFGGPLEEDGKLIGEKTRDNALLLSVGSLLNNAHLSRLYSWFRDRLRVVDMSDTPNALINRTSAQMHKDKVLQEKILTLIGDADFGIERLNIIDSPADFPFSDSEAKRRFPDEFIKQWHVANRKFDLRAVHRCLPGNDTVDFDFLQDESKGTQRLLAIAGPLLTAIANGSLVAVDEFDCSLHPLLTRTILKYFHAETGVDSGAQIILATHDATLFSPGVFRRDELWLVDKYDSAQSQLTSLHDFAENRSTAAFQRNYLQGRYGGIPQFGEMLDRPDTSE